ncbi:MAG: hypothetical protein R2713_11345 [Ilumatobacteraceae bacterium]
MAASNVEAELLPALSAYGLPLGDALQMRDDVMAPSATRHSPVSPSAATCARASPLPLLVVRWRRRRRSSTRCSDLVGQPEPGR